MVIGARAQVYIPGSKVLSGRIESLCEVTDQLTKGRDREADTAEIASLQERTSPLQDSLSDLQSLWANVDSWNAEVTQLCTQLPSYRVITMIGKKPDRPRYGNLVGSAVYLYGRKDEPDKSMNRSLGEFLGKFYDKVRPNPSCRQPLFIGPESQPLCRPLSFPETIDAIVQHYETTGVLLSSEQQICTCTGIAYKARSTKFKIVPVSQDILQLPFTEKDKDGLILVDYDSLDGIELDSRLTAFNSNFSGFDEVYSRPGFVELIGDPTLLRRYIEISYKEDGKARKYCIHFCDIDEQPSKSYIVPLIVQLNNFGTRPRPFPQVHYYPIGFIVAQQKKAD